MILDLYGTLKSRTFRVIWALEEIGLDYTLHKHGPRSEEILALSPLGKVPVLVADGDIITDSTAILHFLADTTGKLTAPAGTAERARQDAMTYFLLDELDACLWAAARHSFVLPEEMRLPAIKDSLRWEWKRSLKELVRRLGDGPFLMGDQMTVADIIATHCGTWGGNAKFEISEPNFEAYLERMTKRPAYLAAKAK